MNLVETSLPADLIRQVGYFVIDMEALMLKVSDMCQERVSYGSEVKKSQKSNYMVLK